MYPKFWSQNYLLARVGTYVYLPDDLSQEEAYLKKLVALWEILGFFRCCGVFWDEIEEIKEALHEDALSRTCYHIRGYAIYLCVILRACRYRQK